MLSFIVGSRYGGGPLYRNTTKVGSTADRNTEINANKRTRIMKTKLVLWGLDEKEERILIALSLHASESKVTMYTFKEPAATEEFSQLMMNDWRDDKEVAFPEIYEKAERPLSVSEPLLPDTYKVERGDVVQRAHTEWQFIALSAKLNRAYESELSELKEKVNKLDKFDSAVWEELKSFWNKVQTQVRERNLFRDHADALRDKTNELFGHMKELRSKLDAEFKKKSSEHQEKFQEKLADIESRIAQGLRLQPIFEELKKLQRQFRDTKFTREDRAKVWKRLDSAFKEVKEKRFGPEANSDRSPFERLQRRYNGLLEAIKKMEKSIKRDEDELSFQKRKIARTDGQLEAQIREAKIKMIQDRIDSKQEKHQDMLKTRKDLESRMEKERLKEERRKAEAEAKKKAKQEIAQKIKEQHSELEKEADKLEKAAEQLKEAKAKDTQDPEPTQEIPPKTDAPLSPGNHALGDVLNEVVDTVNAVALVISHRLDKTPAPSDQSAD